MTTIAVYHLKGGVGKTTTAVNLACCAAMDDDHTLLWDLDPQGAAGFYLGVPVGPRKSGRLLMEGRARLSDMAVASDLAGLDVLPSRFSYRKLDVQLSAERKPRSAVGRALSPLHKVYKWVFLDCPAGVSLLAENVFHAADIILVPVIPTPLSIRSFEEISIFFARRKLDRSRLIPFFSMVEKRKRIHQETMQVFSARETGRCTAIIPSMSDIERMAVTRRPVARFRPRSEAGKAYHTLWNELKGKIASRS